MCAVISPKVRIGCDRVRQLSKRFTRSVDHNLTSGTINGGGSSTSEMAGGNSPFLRYF